MNLLFGNALYSNKFLLVFHEVIVCKFLISYKTGSNKKRLKDCIVNLVLVYLLFSTRVSVILFIWSSLSVRPNPLIYFFINDEYIKHP